MLFSAEMLNMLNHVGSNVPKICFFLLKCWICWIILGLWNAKGTTRGKIIPHIQHFSRKKHFFREGIQHDLTYSTFQQKEAHFSEKSFFLGKNATWPKKVALSAAKIQHGPKSGFFSRQHSTCAENVFLSSEKVPFQVLFCLLLFSVSLSL